MMWRWQNRLQTFAGSFPIPSLYACIVFVVFSCFESNADDWTTEYGKRNAVQLVQIHCIAMKTIAILPQFTAINQFI